MKSAGSPSIHWWARVAPVLRVTLSLLVTAALTGGLLFRKAQAQFDGMMLGLGSRVMAFPGAPAAHARTVRINGLEVQLRTEIVDAPLSRVLRHYRGICGGVGSGSGDYGTVIASLATRSGSTDRDGYVACVDTGVGNLETLIERLVEFSRTWNLNDIGPLRYAYASRSEDDPENKTFLLTMWVEASMSFRDLLPAEQSDAKGTDLNDVPRPPRAQRILSATEISAPSGIYVYLAQAASPAELTHMYRRDLSSRKWNILERNPGESVELNGTRMLSAEKEGRTLSVLTHADDSSATVVTLLVSEAE